MCYVTLDVLIIKINYKYKCCVEFQLFVVKSGGVKSYFLCSNTDEKCEKELLCFNSWLLQVRPHNTTLKVCA